MYHDRGCYAILSSDDLLLNFASLKPKGNIDYNSRIASYGNEELAYARDMLVTMNAKPLEPSPEPEFESAVFPEDNVEPAPAAPAATVARTALEKSRVIATNRRVAAAAGGGGGGGAGSTSRGRSLATISELQVDKFYDLVAEVLKIHREDPKQSRSSYSGRPLECFSLLVTDWSQNPLLYDTSGFEGGPKNHRTLLVSVFGYQSEPLRDQVGLGNIVHLRNVRAKANGEGMLECTMVEEEDERFKHKRDVTILNKDNIAFRAQIQAITK